MLQWMGGGRRKVKTTKKSIQARQHQFFEQRRQQLRSQGAPDLIPDKFSQPQKDIYSLDIASLKNLSQLAQQYAKNQSECAKSLPLDESKKTLCPEENAGTNENSILHCSQPASTLDAAAHLKATYTNLCSVGTQWTPASAAAAAALEHPEPLALQGKCPIPAKDVHAENHNQEGTTSKIQAIPTQEKDRRMDHVQKKPSRQHRFEEFQIMDLINDSHETAKHKNRARSEDYAAYVLEGMGNVPNCTPKADNAGYNKIRHKEAISARNSKHGAQQIPQTLDKDRYKRARHKVQLQPRSISTMDDDHEAVTDLESFSDSNGEQTSGEYKMRRNDSLRDQNSGDMSIWNRSQSMDSNHLSSWAQFEEKGFLGSDFITGPDSSYNAASYQKLFESPKSVGFSLDESMFSICSEYGSSANINCKMDDYDLYDELLSDDDLRDGYSSLSSDDGARSFEIGGSDDKLLMDDFSSRPLPQLVFDKDPDDFSFESPAAEMLSESTFEFQVTILESNILDKDFQSPSLWEREPNTTQENGTNRLSYLAISPSHSEEDGKLRMFNSSKQNDAEISEARNLTVDAESSSLDTIFGTGTLEFASSPTGPLFNRSPQLKLTHGRSLT